MPARIAALRRLLLAVAGVERCGTSVAQALADLRAEKLELDMSLCCASWNSSNPASVTGPTAQPSAAAWSRSRTCGRC